MIGPASNPRPSGEAVPAAALDAGLQYWWLLPGDVTYCPAPATPDPKPAVDRCAGADSHPAP